MFSQVAGFPSFSWVNMFHCMYILRLPYPFILGRIQVVSISWLLWVMLQWARKYMGEISALQCSLQHYTYTFGDIPRNRIARSIFTFWETSMVSTMAKPICIPTNNATFYFLHIIANICYLLSSWFRHSNRCEVRSCDFDYISLMVSDLEHLSMYPLTIRVSFLGKMSILFFCPFLMGFNWIVSVIVNVTKLHEFFTYWGY